jgi:hypothetical protein
MWFVPQRVELVGHAADGKGCRLAQWTPDDDARPGNFIGDLELHLKWCTLEALK